MNLRRCCSAWTDTLSSRDVDDATVRVVIKTRRGGACPECGTVPARVEDRPLRRAKDLPGARQQEGRERTAGPDRS